MSPETPKGVSSRLLTMKFMQRAAASAASSPGTDTANHSSKKRKIGHQEVAQNRFNAEIDEASIQAAISEREAKRQAAIEAHASAADTHWTLDPRWDGNKAHKPDKKPVHVVYVGYGDGHSSDEDEDFADDPRAGRTSTKANEKSKEPDKSNHGEIESPEESQDSNDEDTDAEEEDNDRRLASGDIASSSRKRPHSQARQNSRDAQERSTAKEFRDKRKKKEVKLSKLTSISSAGDSNAPNNSGMQCYNCQQMGHRAAECPTRGAKSRSGLR